MNTCKDCGAAIALEQEADLRGRVESVWTSVEGWVCPRTGDEHDPGGA